MEPTTTRATVPTEIHIADTQESVSLVRFNVYKANNALDGFDTVETKIQELDPAEIVRIPKNVGVLDNTVSINSAVLEQTKLHLDFNQGFYDQLVTYGTTGERFYIGSIVNTFLSAYDAESIMITVNGKIVESGHVIYDFPMNMFE